MIRELVAEQITLVPKAVFIKAKELAKYKLFEQAIKLMEENKVQVVVYDEKNMIIERSRTLISTNRELTRFEKNRKK